MGRRNRGKGKKKRGAKSKQQQSTPKINDNNDGECETEITNNTPTSTSSITTTTTIERKILRFNVGDRVDCNMEGGWEPGTIIMRHTMGSDGEKYHPYGIRLDEGTVVYAPIDTDGCIKKLLDTTGFIDFKVGSRVELLRDGEWKSGTILHSTKNWVDIDPINGAPYSVYIDEMGHSIISWGSRDSIRESQESSYSNEEVNELRFDIGERVECNVGSIAADTLCWMPGTIIKTHYKENKFGSGFVAPYQIQLDIGTRIYAPLDEDGTIRKSDTPAPTCWICFDDEQSLSNPIVRECACRGEANGYVHTQCLAKLAITKAADSKHHLEGIDDQNPFIRCITCKQEFKKDSRSFAALANGLLSAYGSTKKMGRPWNGLAASMFGQGLTTQSLVEAETFLHARCNMILNSDWTPQLDLDLSRFLGDLAGVYEEMGNLEKMKLHLDQSLRLIVDIENGTPSRRKINILSSLAKHSCLVGNTNDALEQYEECISLTRAQAITNDMLLASLLIKSGNLELELGNTERGIAQMSESMDIMTVVYGGDNAVVDQMSDCLDKIRKGTLETMPKAFMGLDFSSTPA